jgi:hypothetical protein
MTYVHQAVVTGVGKLSTDRSSKSEFCSDFSLSHTQAQAFFNQANLITSQQLHHQYDWLPCSVTGSAELGSQLCEWEINAGGVGRLVCGDEAKLLVCESCLL